MTVAHTPPEQVPMGTTDASIIVRSRDEPEQFAQIFDRYYSAIHRYAAARLGPSVADDVAAETFLAAFDRRDRYDTDWPEARAWLYGIATNLISRHRRSEVRYYRALARTPAPDGPADHADRVADRVSAQTLGPDLARGLAALSKGDRDALLLVACAQLSYAQAASALGVKVGTVGSRVNRARRKLRNVLAPMGEEATNHG
ncbi:RNA polymerase sigma factor [Actinomadura algeriensis]|uniref:RNA polymerase sigma-70 factor (ECF subfamily) n=1 Tax=Actinomadura algeriensis TaxID=1679523 RepID=A0ABR9JX34_9ACTN|nr:RNA polymerase sigma factor [Actinomadura algeriensis]MBE1534675.1 RNA polymerase sigma-70 factor (ECF subfamily) [Actinomadura algeriensis]